MLIFAKKKSTYSVVLLRNNMKPSKKENVISKDPTCIAILDILHAYECPPECPAYCCKSFPIQITNHERKILRKLSLEKTNFLKRKELPFGPGYEIDPPCGFLENNRCNAHDRRPLICKIYPFVLEETFIQIHPCIVGLKIAENIMSYQIEMIKKDNPKNKDLLISNLLEIYSSVKEGSHRFYDNIDKPCKMISIPSQNLIHYRDFIKSNL